MPRKDKTSTALAVVPQESITALEAADADLQHAMQCQVGADTSVAPWGRVFGLTTAMQAMREALNAPGVLDNIMALQGNYLGFRTDKDKDGQKYDVATVADVTLAARMHGAYMVGNEVNIVAGRCYLAQSFYARKVRELLAGDTLQSLDIDYGVPRSRDGGAITEVTLKWQRPGEGAPREKKLEVPVRVNKGQGVDAILGKVRRRAEKWLYDHISGQNTPGGEVDGDAPIDVTPVTQPRPDRRKPVEVEDLPHMPPTTGNGTPEIAAICVAMNVPRDILTDWCVQTRGGTSLAVTSSLEELTPGARQTLFDNAERFAGMVKDWADTGQGAEA